MRAPSTLSITFCYQKKFGRESVLRAECGKWIPSDTDGVRLTNRVSDVRGTHRMKNLFFSPVNSMDIPPPSHQGLQGSKRM